MGSLQAGFQRPHFDLLSRTADLSEDSIRGLPDLVHFNAIHNPDLSFCKQSRQSQRPDEPFEEVEVTFYRLATAIERCCVWILSNIKGAHPAQIASDGSVRKSPPLALFLESDATLFVYIAALLTLNIPCVLLSIRLNPQAIQHLLQQTGSASVVVSQRTRPSVEDAACGVKMTMVASLESFLDPSLSADPYVKRVLQVRRTIREEDRNVLILHSSGTTGFPKAIALAHRYVLGYAACHEFLESEDLSKKGYNLSTLPLFHGFGLLAPSLALSVGMSVWFPPSSVLPSSGLVIQLIKRAKGRITSLMTVPTIAEDLTLMPDFSSSVAQELAKLDLVVVGGGALKHSVGDDLHSHGVTILNHFGATELGALAPVFYPGGKDYDWHYLRIRRDLALELQVIKREGDVRTCKLLGRMFGGKGESRFELQDHLEANPRNPTSEVLIRGRNDDLIVLATGEKVSPRALEDALEQHPFIKRAVVFGNGQFEIGLLIEPRSDDMTDSSEAFIGAIWPLIEEANERMDDHARVSSRAAVLIKPSGSSIPLSDKGSVRRKEIHTVFKSEIDEVYRKLEQDDSNKTATPFDLETPKDSLREIAELCLPVHSILHHWRDDDDFVALGLDSLRATRFRRLLSASLRKTEHVAFVERDLPMDIIYSQPSISSLAEAIERLAQGQGLDVNKVDNMMRLVRKYSHGHKNILPSEAHSTVVITGTTGNLGANMLENLAMKEHVRRIICLIRPGLDDDGNPKSYFVKRQHQAFKDRGIGLSENAWPKLTFLPWFPGRDRLGLEEDEYQHLATQVTHIFHGAWPMDFKVKLHSLEPQIKAVQELLQLGRAAHACRPAVKPRVVLASSIAVVGQYPQKTQSLMVPEAPIEDPGTPLPIGYAEAKWVCEKVMQSAAELSDEIEPIIIRVGQLSGSQGTGFWSPKEHIPALIEASQAIGALPDLHGSLSWIPVDTAARVAVEVMMGSEPRQLVYHLENPVRQSWPNMCTVIEHALGLKKAQRIPFQDWLDKVARRKGSSQNLVDFFQHHFLHMSGGGIILDTSAARKVSPALRSTGSVEKATVDLYLDYWMRGGFLKSPNL